MMREGWYCVASGEAPKKDKVCGLNGGDCDSCRLYHRKHETPDQFKERTGRDWPDDRAVYVMLRDRNPLPCIQVRVETFNYAKHLSEVVGIFCANTDFGPPEGDFEEEV